MPPGWPRCATCGCVGVMAPCSCTCPARECSGTSNCPFPSSSHMPSRESGRLAPSACQWLGALPQPVHHMSTFRRRCYGCSMGKAALHGDQSGTSSVQQDTSQMLVSHPGSMPKDRCNIVCFKGRELTSSSKTPSRVMMRCSGILSSISPAGTTKQLPSTPADMRCLMRGSAPRPARVPAPPTFLHILGCHCQIDLLPCPLRALHCDLLLRHAGALQQWSMCTWWKTSKQHQYQRLKV